MSGCGLDKRRKGGGRDHTGEHRMMNDSDRREDIRERGNKGKEKESFSLTPGIKTTFLDTKELLYEIKGHS